VIENLRLTGFKSLLSDRKGNLLSSGGDSELCFAIRLAGYSLYYQEDLKFRHFIPEGRLQWDYLVKLHKSFARSTPIIELYYLVGQGTTKSLTRLFFRRKLLLLGRLMKYFPDYLLKLSKPEGEDIIMRYNIWIEELKYYSLNSKKLINAYQMIKNLNNNLKSISEV
jgi:hypothetical protein